MDGRRNPEHTPNDGASARGWCQQVGRGAGARRLLIMSFALRSPVEFLGNDPYIVSLLEAANRAAASDATVLIHGESGVGKTLLAEHIHAHSLRAGSRLVTIRCVALPDSLLESELFGDTYHTAIGGTVVIDGIAELSLRVQ